MKNNGAKLLVDCLIRHEVRYVFGIPGAKVDSIFEALRLADGKIKLILCRHEQNAAFMAAIYGRLTGKPGIVIVTSGPGVTNLATGLLTATTEGDPVIAIGANVPRAMRLKQTHQSLDNALAMKPVTKYSVEILVPQSIPETIETAFRVSTEGRGGAAFLSLPQDVLLEKTDTAACNPASTIRLGASPESSICKAADFLNQAQYPILLLGMHASQPRNTEAVRGLLNHCRFPVVCTFQGAGVVPKELLSCFIGRVGLFRNQPGDEALKQADVVLAIGYDPVEYDPEIWNLENSSKIIIHLDASPSELHMTYMPAIELVGDLPDTLQKLILSLKPQSKLNHSEEILRLRQPLLDKIKTGASRRGTRIHPLRFIHDLHQVIDEDTTIISDIGSHYMWLARHFFLHKPRHLLFSNGQQTMGVALPWALAARLVRPDSKIISISGDGGFLFSSMELETAVREKLNFVHCVWRDGTYNMVMEQQIMKYQHESGVHLGRIDLVKYAESFGARGYTLQNSEELLPCLKEALRQSVPVLIDIPIDYSENKGLFEDIHPNAGN